MFLLFTTAPFDLESVVLSPVIAFPKELALSTIRAGSDLIPDALMNVEEATALAIMLPLDPTIWTVSPEGTFSTARDVPLVS